MGGLLSSVVVFVPSDHELQRAYLPKFAWCLYDFSDKVSVVEVPTMAFTVATAYRHSACL